MNTGSILVVISVVEAPVEQHSDGIIAGTLYSILIKAREC